MNKKAIHAPHTLNEAYNYDQPAAFVRGLKVELPSPATLIYISGTASVDEKGDSIHLGDFKAQTLRTFQNITEILKASHAFWKDIVKTTVYIKDIKQNYKTFNELRCQFFKEQELAPYPSSTCVQAHLCRDDLLIEIEAQAIIKRA